MNFFTAHWDVILGCVVAVAMMVALIILYKKNRINEEYITTLADYLDTLDDGEGMVSLLASYAKKAVLAVEQMVKAGVLAKTDEERKNKAMQIVSELASADDIVFDENAKEAASSLIEAEVFELKHHE